MSDLLRYDESAECRLPGQLEQIAPAVARLGVYLKSRGISEADWKAVELAVTEALNNAVMHGCKGREEEGVRLQWSWSGDMLTVVVHDPSDFMPPENVSADLPEDPRAESGRGHFLMSSLMDGLAHVMIDGHHAVELQKRLGTAQWSPEVAAEATLNALSAELGSCYENLSAVFRFSEVLATARDFSEFCETVLTQLNTLVRARQSYIRMATEDGLALRQAARAGLADFSVPSEIDLKTEGLEVEVFRSRIGRGAEKGRSLSEDDPLHENDGAVTVCPIFFRNDVLGCLIIARPGGEQPFLASESSLIRVVADFLGIAYIAGRSHEEQKHEERVRRELEIASSIQQSLLPRSFPYRAPYRSFGLCRSAREVGGDYYTIVPVEDRGLLLVVADVMGKGMPAALLATILRTAIQSRPHLAATPGRLLSEVNHQLATDLDQLDMFITATVAFLSYAENTLYYADAGHCPILIRRAGEPALLQVQADGFPLGVSKQFEYPAETIKIEPGDLFILITDGIYENLHEHGLASSFHYLKEQILTLNFHDDLSDFCQQVLRLSEENKADLPLLDDRTILVVERHNPTLP